MNSEEIELIRRITKWPRVAGENERTAVVIVRAPNAITEAQRTELGERIGLAFALSGRTQIEVL